MKIFNGLDVDQSYQIYEADQRRQRAAVAPESFLEWLWRILGRAWGRAEEYRGAGVFGGSYTHGATAGWYRATSNVAFFQIDSISSLGYVYCFCNSAGSPGGTGSDTPGAFILRPGQSIRGIMSSVWIYCPASAVVAFSWSVAGGASQSVFRVRPTEDIPTGAIGTLAPDATVGGTIMLAADSRREFVILENTGLVDVFLNIVGGTPVLDRGIYLPAGGYLSLEGTPAKGGINGITAAGAATIIYQTGVI